MFNTVNDSATYKLHLQLAPTLRLQGRRELTYCSYNSLALLDSRLLSLTNGPAAEGGLTPAWLACTAALTPSPSWSPCVLSMSIADVCCCANLITAGQYSCTQYTREMD